MARKTCTNRTNDANVRCISVEMWGSLISSEAERRSTTRYVHSRRNPGTKASFPMGATSSLIPGTGLKGAGAVSSAGNGKGNGLMIIRSSSGVTLGRQRLAESTVGRQILDFTTSKWYPK